MFPFFLKFSDDQFEEKYQKDFKSIDFFSFFKLIILELVFGLILTIFNFIYDQVTVFRILFFCLISIAIIVLMFVIKEKKSWKYLKTFCIILHFFILIVSLEITADIFLQKDCNDLRPFIYISAVQVFFSIFSLAIIKWTFFLFLSFIIQMTFLFRIYPIENKNFALATITHLMCAICNSMVGYYHEKATRLLYKHINDSNKQLTNFEILLKNIIPTPIFIFNIFKKHCDFYNIAGQNFLKKYSLEGDEVYQNIQNLFMKFIPLDSEKPTPNLNTFVENPNILKDSDQMEFFKAEVYCETSAESKELKKIYFYQLKFLKIIWDSQPCLLLVIDDISDSHQIKELKKLDEYKNQLLATVSHDLRTPLNGMMGIIELVKLKLTEKKDKKNLDIAIASGHLLLNMINDILDFSQINNKKLRLNIQKIDLIKTVKETCKLVKFQAKSKGLDFQLKHDNLPTAILYSDNNRIRQILLNLLNNALKFTKNGFIRLKVKNISDNPNGVDLYKISVKDSGIGIKKDDFSKLFKLFGKLEQENMNINSNGVGLGLTISQTLSQILSPKIENSGIHLKSEYGIGSKFWFLLEGENRDQVSQYLPSEFSRKNIPYIFFKGNDEIKSFINFKESFLDDAVLIVDDDMMNLMVAQRYCEYYGVNFLTATNGEEACKIIMNKNSNSAIKGIFMDCNMPIMDGFRATEELLKFWRERNMSETPIVAMTANILATDLEKCITSGMTSFLCKPVSKKDFGEALQKVFGFYLPNQ